MPGPEPAPARGRGRDRGRDRDRGRVRMRGRDRGRNRGRVRMRGPGRHSALDPARSPAPAACMRDGQSTSSPTDVVPVPRRRIVHHSPHTGPGSFHGAGPVAPVPGRPGERSASSGTSFRSCPGTRPLLRCRKRPSSCLTLRESAMPAPRSREKPSGAVAQLRKSRRNPMFHARRMDMRGGFRETSRSSRSSRCSAASAP